MRGLFAFCHRFPVICRYGSRNLGDAFVGDEEDEDEFWLNANGSTGTIGEALKLLLTRTTKPVSVIIGQKSHRKRYGHALTLVILRERTQLCAYAKDSLPIRDATLQTYIYDILQQLTIDQVTLVGCLDTEESIVFTDCLKEAYRVVGNILDGTYFWNLRLDSFQRIFDVKGRKEVFPHGALHRRLRRGRRVSGDGSGRGEQS